MKGKEIAVRAGCRLRKESLSFVQSPALRVERKGLACSSSRRFEKR